MGDDKDVESASSQHVTVLDRISHLTWVNFMTTMGTGGIAVLLGQQPHTFTGLKTIGKVVYIWDLFLFTLFTILTVIRFSRQSDLFARSFRNPGEALYAPAVLLSVANIIICMEVYGVPSSGPWLIVAIRVVFWIYVAVALLMAISVYAELFAGREMTEQDVIPAWLMPVLPSMLSGTVASSIASMQPPYYRQSILVAGVTLQGLGFWAGISLYGPFVTRFMKIGFPAAAIRPGMFLLVAPPSFTALALINMSLAVPTTATYFVNHPAAAETLQIIALAFGIFLWALAFWWFCISLISTLMSIGKTTFRLIWYSMIFPNVGFILATSVIGKGLYSNAIAWVASIMTIFLVATYLFILTMHVRAIYRHDILWPGKDEDKET